MTDKLTKSNVDVTLAPSPSAEPARLFPCPLCATQLDVRQSFRNKPYCVCQSCGLQIFFRGQKGISRLRKLLDEHKRLIGGPATPAIAVFNQLEQLRTQRHELERRRPLIFADADLEHAIAALEHDIERLQQTLLDLSRASKS